ncbi:PPC domain-containing DNA-binding protein [Leptothermofonsia sp. ETS-13]|uniref:PPC domain-containing DNA-binding protein n=1 Tax=Leptothermofonsia sp. ETS-13 TaxID=3035696 RepID=UPI003BA1C415
MDIKIFALRLKPGMDLKASLWEFIQANGIQAGFILTTVGSLKRVSLRLAGQSDSQIFEGKFEIVSLVGTLSQDGLHLHISISDSEGKTIGGHLTNGSIINTTAEIVIGESHYYRFTRTVDEQTGYKELQIEQRG